MFTPPLPSYHLFIMSPEVVQQESPLLNSAVSVLLTRALFCLPPTSSRMFQAQCSVRNLVTWMLWLLLLLVRNLFVLDSELVLMNLYL